MLQRLANPPPERHRQQRRLTRRLRCLRLHPVWKPKSNHQTRSAQPSSACRWSEITAC